MSGQRHVILRQTLELAVSTSAAAWRWQDEARRVQDRLVALLERCCDELSAPDCLQRIDRLELDLGVLDGQRFAEEYLARFETTLRDGLAKAIARQKDDVFTARLNAQWELLSAYLRQGRLPWWADLAVAEQPQASLALLMQEAPDVLHQRLTPLLAGKVVRQRLASRFADSMLRRLVALLGASTDPLPDPFPGVLAHALIEAGPASAAWGADEWRQRVWDSVLDNLRTMSLAQTLASRSDYSRSVLRRLSSGWAGAYPGLIEHLQAHLATGTGSDSLTVRAILTGLADELLMAMRVNRPAVSDRAVAWPAARPAQRPALGAPSADARRESLSVSSGLGAHSEDVSFDGIDTAQAAMRHMAKSVAPFASPATAEPPGKDDLAKVPSPVMSSELPVADCDPARPAGLPTQIPAMPVPDDAAVSRSAARPQTEKTLTSPMTVALSSSADLACAAVARSPMTQPVGQAWDSDDGDAIPVHNAGLVILWPFLKTFFQRLRLLSDKVFSDEMAQQRGAILLHCLASGADDVPEYLLPLNKVLCGLPLDALCAVEEPLRSEEIAEAGHLLTTVIAQIPILNEMSAAGFRASFLLRSGLLDVRDGSWLLRVERETFDVLLERFPWGFAWVKLPWMAVPLQVEW